jgi:hypothetical protein
VMRWRPFFINFSLCLLPNLMNMWVKETIHAMESPGRWLFLNFRCRSPIFSNTVVTTLNHPTIGASCNSQLPIWEIWAIWANSKPYPLQMWLGSYSKCSLIMPSSFNSHPPWGR